MKTLRARNLFLLGFCLLSTELRSQPLYSMNALGYVDLSLSPGSNFVTQPFNTTDLKVAKAFPRMPAETFFTVWNSAQQSFGPTNFYDPLSGWSDPNMQFRLPQGALLWVTQQTTVSLSGELIPGISFVPGSGFGAHLLGAIPRAFSGFCSDFDTCDDTPPDQTVICKWNPVAQVCNNYTYFSLGLDSGWYDNSLNRVDVQLARGEAALFLVQAPFHVPALPPPTSLGVGHGMGRAQRTSTNFSFNFNAPSNAPFAVLRAPSLSAGAWNIVQEGITTGSVHQVTLTEPNTGSAFYRIVPPGQFSLFHETRTPGQFSFQFYAPSNGTYFLERRLATSWQNISTLADVTKGVRTFTDSSATSAKADYRVVFIP